MTAIRYCLPIMQRSLGEASALIREHLDRYQYFELWVDYLEGPVPGDLLRLAAELNDRLIITLRRRDLAEPELTSGARRQLIEAVANEKIYLDLDVRQQSAEIEFLRASGSSLKTILSYHNYQLTPGELELHEIIDEMAAKSAAISKIATHCRDMSDALRLLACIPRLKEQGARFIILGMGSWGAVTRVFGTLWGNEMIFAPESSDAASAPGQLTRGQLEKIFTALGE